MNRREFHKSLFSTFATVTFLESCFLSDAFSNPIRPIARHWLNNLDEMCRDLKTNKISQLQWQNQIKTLLETVEMKDFLKLIDFERLTQGFQYPDLGVNTKNMIFPKLEGLPQNYAFTKKIFGMKKDRAIIPNGHKNMVSSHLVIKGEVELKHYDKIEEDATSMVIEPTIDELVKPGSSSSISDEKNNIHWLKATTETAFTFDVIVVDLNRKSYEIDNIDPDTGVKMGDKRLRVKKLDVETALKKYGKGNHH